MRVETDVGEGFLKALGNPEGPHVLASEWVGSQLADLLSIPTLDFTLVQVDSSAELPMKDAGHARPGAAFISRLDEGLSWGGAARQLAHVVNKQHLSAIVVLDTWIRNRDRFCAAPARRNPDNVWLSRKDVRGRGVRVMAIDHTHCFADGTQLTTAMAGIAVVKDERVYGLFPEFAAYLGKADMQAACARLAAVPKDRIVAAIETIPQEWEVAGNVRKAWMELLVQRAAYVAETLVQKVFP